MPRSFAVPAGPADSFVARAWEAAGAEFGDSAIEFHDRIEAAIKKTAAQNLPERDTVTIVVPD